MKYHVSPLPNTGTAVNFKFGSDDKKNETKFSFSKTVLDIWGNPLEPMLKELMIAYVKKNGWPKQAVEMNPKNSPRSLKCYIADMPKKTKA